MRALVVFESMFGNTEVVARAVAEGLSSRLGVETARARQWGEEVAAAVMGPGRMVHR